MGIKIKFIVCIFAFMVIIMPQFMECESEGFVLYHEASALYAGTITKDALCEYEKFEIITNYITKYIIYDYIRAIKMSKNNGIPDLDYVWNNKRGICIDIASLATSMLRAVGIEAWVCIGITTKGYPHAWVEAIINDETYIYDHEGDVDIYKTILRY